MHVTDGGTDAIHSCVSVWYPATLLDSRMRSRILGGGGARKGVDAGIVFHLLK